MASVSHSSMHSAGESHFQRVQIALLVKDLPPSTAVSTRADTDIVLGGAGYGPPLLSQLTPVQRLAAELTLPAPDAKQREHELLCVPITNSLWKARWEAMCVIGAQDSGTNTYHFSRRMSDKKGTPSATRTSKEVEAERWRINGGFTRDEVNITRSEETRLVIGQAAEWLELDSPIEGIRFDSELALKQEIAYASHLHISTAILPAPRQPKLASEYARAISDVLSVSQFITLALRLPIGNANVRGSEDVAWEIWNTIRSLNAYNSRLVLALELTTPLPSGSALERWKAEPMRLIIVPAHIFVSNASGYPVLSKGCQSFLKSIFKLKPTIIISQSDQGLHKAGGPDAYSQYMRFLERRQEPASPIEQYAGAYMDYLQAPLQPLMDNLETDTYEGFERDPVKYAQYEEAIFEALLDRPADTASTVFVVGAGRGPLVAATLKASSRAGRKVQITAVEKNSNAVVILQERQALEWNGDVEVVFSDMRSFRPGTQADLIVSELLGSFGDNELSPECLDSVMRWLKPEGACIPCSYTSYLAPLSSAKLHAEVTGPQINDPVRMSEQPYVVMFQQAHLLSGHGGRGGHQRIQSCWNFTHPRADVVLDDESGLPLSNGHNARTAQLTFHIPEAGVLHGFAGFFEAVLYKDIGLSIVRSKSSGSSLRLRSSKHPERMDVRQLSWFPLFFPLRDPLYLPRGSELDVHIARLTDQVKRQIHFEWSAEAYLWLPPSHETAPTRAVADPAAAAKENKSPRGGWADAFASAVSPRLGGTPRAEPGSGWSRVLIGQTRLHNPLGRSSYVGL